MDLSGDVPPLTALLETSYLLYRQPVPDLKPGETVKDFPKFDKATYFDPEFDHNLVLRKDLAQMVIDTKCFAVREKRPEVDFGAGREGPDLSTLRSCQRSGVPPRPHGESPRRRGAPKEVAPGARAMKVSRRLGARSHRVAARPLEYARRSAGLRGLSDSRRTRRRRSPRVQTAAATTCRITPARSVFPGGAREGDEDAKECAVRETCEEMGITSDALEVFGPFARSRFDRGVSRGAVRRAARTSGSLRAGDRRSRRGVRSTLRRVFSTASSGASPKPATKLARFRRVPYFQHGERRIWGLTGIMLRDFVTQVLGYAPPV